MADFDYNKALELSAMCHNIQCFECEGRIFKGYEVDVIKRYMKENPSKKFYIWLQDNVEELTVVSKNGK